MEIEISFDVREAMIAAANMVSPARDSVGEWISSPKESGGKNRAHVAAGRSTRSAMVLNSGRRLISVPRSWHVSADFEQVTRHSEKAWDPV